MNITLSSQIASALTNEASRRNGALSEDATLHTVESIAEELLLSAALAYEATAQDNYVHDIYERIKAADAKVQSEIFAFAEQKAPKIS